MIISRTPFRVSLFGGGTDYPAWFKEHGGAVLGTSIDKYCYISVRYLPPYFPHKSRIVYRIEEWVDDNSEIEHPAVRECLKYLSITQGIEISHQSDLLAKKGIGASSAFVVGLLHALHSFHKSIVDKERLAEQAILVEREWIEESVGYQDQYHCAVGGFNHIKFNPSGSVEIIPIKEGYCLQPYVMLFDTGSTRVASKIARATIEQIPNRQGELTEMSLLVEEAIKSLEKGKVEDIARLLNESWELKKRLSDRITTPRIDAIYSTAMESGALGGKLLGAGGGGYLLLLVKPEKHDSVVQALRDLIYVPFKFEKLILPGSIEPRYGRVSTGSQIIFRDVERVNSHLFSGEERI